MQPFDNYPTDKDTLESNAHWGSNCRHEYGLKLHELTGQTRCAYCGISLVDDYYHWLLMSVDHVVPVNEANRLGIPPALIHGVVNAVLACSGCNGLDNKRTMPDEQPPPKWTLEEFTRLRDRFFSERKARIAERRAEEMRFFDRTWGKNQRTDEDTK
jgi:hypothetical protein